MNLRRKAFCPRNLLPSRVLDEREGDMADTEDPIQQAADAAAKKWTDSAHSLQLEHLPGIAGVQIAAELTRMRFEMTAIRQLLESRKNVDGGSF